MKITSHVNKLYYTVFMISAVLMLTVCLHAKASSKPVKPEVNGRPVYMNYGKVIVFPEGVEEAPDDYIGALGANPLALIKINNKIVGEIYSAPLRGTAVYEAEGMASSADNNEKIELIKRATMKDDGDNIEVVTLRMRLKSSFGNPWIFHSLYFPQKKSSVTFKLIAAEDQFESLLPYFETMLFPE